MELEKLRRGGGSRGLLLAVWHIATCTKFHWYLRHYNVCFLGTCIFSFRKVLFKMCFPPTKNADLILTLLEKFDTVFCRDQIVLLVRKQLALVLAYLDTCFNDNSIIIQ